MSQLPSAPTSKSRSKLYRDRIKLRNALQYISPPKAKRSTIQNNDEDQMVMHFPNLSGTELAASIFLNGPTRLEYDVTSDKEQNTNFTVSSTCYDTQCFDKSVQIRESVQDFDLLSHLSNEVQIHERTISPTFQSLAQIVEDDDSSSSYDEEVFVDDYIDRISELSDATDQELDDDDSSSNFGRFGTDIASVISSTLSLALKVAAIAIFLGLQMEQQMLFLLSFVG